MFLKLYKDYCFPKSEELMFFPELQNNIMDTDVPDICSGILEPDKKEFISMNPDILQIISTEYPCVKFENFQKRIVWIF